MRTFAVRPHFEKPLLPSHSTWWGGLSLTQRNRNVGQELSRYSDWLRAGRSWIESRRGRDFPPIQTGPGAHPASCIMGTVSFPGVRQPKRCVDYPPHSSAEVKERVKSYISPIGSFWPVPEWIICSYQFKPLNAELNPICHLLALLGAHHIFHVSGLRVKYSLFFVTVQILWLNSVYLLTYLLHGEESFLRSQLVCS